MQDHLRAPPADHPLTEFDQNFNQIDNKLNNMIDYMASFVNSCQYARKRDPSPIAEAPPVPDFEAMKPMSLPVRRDFRSASAAAIPDEQRNQFSGTVGDGLQEVKRNPTQP